MRRYSRFVFHRLPKPRRKGSNKQKIGDFYFTGMDSNAINKNGLSPLQAELDMIDAIHDGASLMKTVAHIQKVSGSPMFGMYVGQDDKISSNVILFTREGWFRPQLLFRQ